VRDEEEKENVRINTYLSLGLKMEEVTVRNSWKWNRQFEEGKWKNNNFETYV